MSQISEDAVRLALAPSHSLSQRGHLLGKVGANRRHAHVVQAELGHEAVEPGGARDWACAWSCRILVLLGERGVGACAAGPRGGP